MFEFSFDQALKLFNFAGKGILGWVGTNMPPGNPVLASKSGGTFPWPGALSSQAPGKVVSNALHDVKIVVGNKTIMAEEDIAISKPVDEYMRDMEVRVHTAVFTLEKAHHVYLPNRQKRLCILRLQTKRCQI